MSKAEILKRVKDSLGVNKPIDPERRNALRAMGLAAAGLFLSGCRGCQPEGESSAGEKSTPTPSPTAFPTREASPTPTATPKPTETSTPTPEPTPKPVISFKVYRIGGVGGPEEFSLNSISGLETPTPETEASKTFWETVGNLNEVEQQVLERIAQDKVNNQDESGVILQRFIEGKEGGILTFDEEGNPLYCAWVDEENGKGKIWNISYPLDSGDSKKAVEYDAKDRVLEVVEAMDGGESRAVKPIVKDGQLTMEEVMGKRVAIFDTEKGEWVASEETKEIKWEGMPKFEFKDDWDLGLEINEAKTQALWDNMLRAMAAGELFRVIEGERSSRGGNIDWSVVRQEWRILQDDISASRWHPSDRFLVEVDKYSQVMLAEMDSNNGLLSGVLIPYIKRAQNELGFYQADIDMKKVIFYVTKVDNANTMGGPILVGHSQPMSGTRLMVNEDNHLLVKLMSNKPPVYKVTPGPIVSFAESSALEALIDGYGGMPNYFTRIYKTKLELDQGESVGYGIIDLASLYSRKNFYNNLFIKR